MRIAYADPPYPGCAHLYADHPDYAGEVDHVALIHHLHEVYDGWALSTSSKALQEVLAMCPGVVRVLIWVKNTVRYAWEPVIIESARPPDSNLRDWIHAEVDAYQWRAQPESYVIGQKPDVFSRWLFAWLGADPADEFTDLFPGSGAVGREWDRFVTQTQLMPAVSRNLRAEKRARAKALRQHPRLDV